MAGNAGKGRPKGALNKATKDVKEAARKHGPKALEVLSRLMLEAESETAQIAAAKEILDRAYGRSTQPIANEEGQSLALHVIERRIVKAGN
jgi:hypothetical protein